MSAKTYRLPAPLGGGEYEALIEFHTRVGDKDRARFRIPGVGLVDVPYEALTEVPPPTPPEPAPGAYMIRDGLVRRLSESPRDTERWACVGNDEWFDWARIWSVYGGPEVAITPLVALPDVELPWEYDGPTRVELAGGRDVRLTMHRPSVKLDADEADAIGWALIAAARAARREGSGT